MTDFPKDDLTTRDLDWRERGYCNRGDTEDEIILGECQYCGQMHVKNIHTIERMADHPTCPKTLEVGYRCAELLCQKYGVTGKNYHKEKAEWEKQEWAGCVIGNLFLNRYGFTFSIVPVEGGFRWWVSGSVTEWGVTTYGTHEDARTGLFNYLYDGDKLGRVSAEVFRGLSLRVMLEKIGEVRSNWADLFIFDTPSRGTLEYGDVFGQVTCVVYADGETWKCELQLPCEQGSKSCHGGDHGCAADARIKALEIFQREMVPFVYRLALLDPRGLLVPPITETERQQIRDDQAITDRKLKEREYQRQVAEEQRQIEAERLRKAEEERLREAEEDRKKHEAENAHWLKQIEEQRKRDKEKREQERIAWEAGAEQREIEAAEDEVHRRAAWDAEQEVLEGRLKAAMAAKAERHKVAREILAREKESCQDDPVRLRELYLAECSRYYREQARIDPLRLEVLSRPRQEARRRKAWDEEHTRSLPEAGNH
jgi:hypothetical protein